MESAAFLLLSLFSACIFSSTRVHASRGDASTHFQNCVKDCRRVNCTSEARLSTFVGRQALLEKLLGWDCPEECKYECMWKTTEVFQEKTGSVPQFYGKWPFVRFLGIQEPASAVFSLLNGLAHVAGFLRIRNRVAPGAPFRNWWLAFSLLSVLCWIFSTVFHTRDTYLTERLDYAGGMVVNVAALAGLAMRLIGPKRMTGVAPSVILGSSASFVYRHLKFLYGVDFDYGYNMKVHILIGSVHVSGWLAWSVWNFRACPYSWKGALANSLIAASMALELLDFPPLLWTFDAHALWHLTTVPLIPLWYSFVIDDCNHLFAEAKEERKRKSE